MSASKPRRQKSLSSAPSVLSSPSTKAASPLRKSARLTSKPRVPYAQIEGTSYNAPHSIHDLLNLLSGASPLQAQTTEPTTHNTIHAAFKDEALKHLEEDVEDALNEVKMLRIVLKDERRRRLAAEAVVEDQKRAMIRARAELVW